MKRMKMSFTNDKFLHFTISFLLVTFFTNFVELGTAFILAMLVGWAKEVYDHYSPHHVFDLKDISANSFGGLAAILFMIVFG